MPIRPERLRALATAADRLGEAEKALDAVGLGLHARIEFYDPNGSYPRDVMGAFVLNADETGFNVDLGRVRTDD